MKNFEFPTMSSVPGLTASHDSEWFEFRCCGPHGGCGLVEPGGTGYPPPSTGELATTLVPTNVQDGLAPLVIANTPAIAPAVNSPAAITSALFTVLPLRSRYSVLDVRREITPADRSPRRWLWVRDDVDRRRVRVRRRPDVVDNVVDRPVVRDREIEDVMQRDARRDGHFERGARVDRRIYVEKAVAAQAPALVRLHRVADLVGGVTERRVGLLPVRLARRVIRHLVLEHDRLAVLALPEHLVLLVVLDEEARGGY